MFASGGEAELAEALRRIQDVPDAAIEAMGRAGRDWVVAEFSVAAYQSRIREVYATLGVRESTALRA